MGQQKRYILYLRISTQGQQKSGLGLEAQKRDIDLYLENYSEQPYEILGTFTDVQSGGDNNRPELKKAIELAKKTKVYYWFKRFVDYRDEYLS